MTIRFEASMMATASGDASMFGRTSADLAALDQHIRLREVANLPVEGEYDAALEQNAAFTLDTGKLSI
jgi:hypothetical protein